MAEIPSRLTCGDKVAIIAPGAPVKPEYVYGACDVLRTHGLEPAIMPHALGTPDGIYAATLDQRADDFITAWSDPEVKAILCARGGYGSVQLVPRITAFLDSHPQMPPKWLIGFSDITVFHALLNARDIATIHGPMAKNIATTPNESIDRLFSLLLEGPGEQHLSTSHPYNFPGEAIGTTIGGNLATYMGLPPSIGIEKAFELYERVILFIEDIGEQIYEINRMLWRLGLSGALQRLAGIVVGQFTEYRSDRSYERMEEMIRDTLLAFKVSCPVAFGYPAGHIDNNLPILSGYPSRISAG